MRAGKRDIIRREMYFRVLREIIVKPGSLLRPLIFGPRRAPIHQEKTMFII